MKRKATETITDEVRKKIARETGEFFQEKFESELSQFRAEMLVDFMVDKIFPAVYNEALLDARAYLTESLQEMEDSLYRTSGDSRTISE